MSERWFVALPYRAKSGVAMVDVRAKTVEDTGMGSRFVCSTTPDDAEQIVRDHNAALGATADRGLAAESVLASSRLVDHEGQCVTCWTYVGDPDPEPHAPGCLIERLRAALSGSSAVPDGGG